MPDCPDCGYHDPDHVGEKEDGWDEYSCSECGLVFEHRIHNVRVNPAVREELERMRDETP